jgi:hypothetical protein
MEGEATGHGPWIATVVRDRRRVGTRAAAAVGTRAAVTWMHCCRVMLYSLLFFLIDMTYNYY